MSSSTFAVGTPGARLSVRSNPLIETAASPKSGTVTSTQIEPTRSRELSAAATRSVHRSVGTGTRAYTRSPEASTRSRVA